MKMTQNDVQPNKYLVLITVCLGTILTGYVGSSINIALPNIMQAFGFTMDSVVWVSLAYMIPYGSTLPIMGKLGDQFGRKKIYVFGLGVFTVSTLLVGLAWNSSSLIFFRVLQGLGAGLLFPNAMALVSGAFPANERGQALGMWGALAASGSAFGPTIGGYIIEHMTWRLIFYTIIPISVIGLFMAAVFLVESKVNDDSVKIDYFGGLLLVLSLSALLMALNQGSKEGWASAYIIMLLVTSISALATFIYVEKNISNPLVDLNLFRNSTFTTSNLVGFLSFLALYGGMFLLPFFLRNILNYSAIKAGTAMLPLVGAMILLAPLGGKLADNMGSRVPAAIGMAIIASALYSFHFMDDRITNGAIGWRLVLMGVGLAFTMSPLSNGVMATLPKDKIGVGSGVFNLFKNIGGSVGVAIMGTLLNDRQIFHTSILTEYIHSGSETVSRTINMLQVSFIHNGMPAGQAQTAAAVVLQGMVTKQASIAAFDDVFLVTAILCSLGVVLAMFIKDPRQDAENDTEPSLITDTDSLEVSTRPAV